MPGIVLVAVLIVCAFVAVNVGSKEKMPFAKVALVMLIVCALAYLASPAFAPLVAWLMQMGQHLPAH